MKKFLSLVLALVMTMSLVTVSAGAKDFADDSDIDYKAAVDVISELGVVDGYSDDSFRPDGLLTRGAAAKIICNLILGPTTASALSASTASRFQSTLTLERDGIVLNLKSMIGLLSQTIPKDVLIWVVADGVDEQAATEAVMSVLTKQI